MNYNQLLQEKSHYLIGDATPDHIFRQARELLSDYQRWAQDAVALDADGQKVRANDPAACAWCLEGAIAKYCNSYGFYPSTFAKFFDSLVEKHFNFSGNTPEFNDTVMHDRMLMLLDIAIDTLQQEVSNGFLR